MKVRTWLDTITDESNQWLNAVRMEDSGDFFHAPAVYLDDALQCMKTGSLARAAISCSSAANCLARLGDFEDALLLYAETASIYEENANLNAKRSIRESSWSLLHSFEYFILVSDEPNAQRIAKKYVELSIRADQFDGKDKALNTLGMRRERVQEARMELERGRRSVRNDNRMFFAKAVDDFLNNSRRPSEITSSGMKAAVVDSNSRRRDNFRFEGSIGS